MSKIKVVDLILVLLIILEILLTTYFFPNNILGQKKNSFSAFIVSLAIGITVMVKFYDSGKVSLYKSNSWKSNKYLILFYFLVVYLLYKINYTVIHTIDYAKISDVIPAVRILAQRFLYGKYVYSNDAWASIHQTTHPGYMPMHWLPIVIAEYFHRDPRTITFLIWLAGTALLIQRLQNNPQKWLQIAFPSLLYLMINYLYTYNINVLGVTVEIMFGGYYMLLLTATNRNSYILMSLAAAFCMMSRYYIIFWFPLWIFVMLINKESKYVIKTIIGALVLVLVIYIIPFASKDWSILNIFTKDYERAAWGEWIYNLGEKGPNHLYAGNGFAFMIYEEYLHYDLLKGFHILKNLLMVIPMLTILALGFWYWQHRNKVHYKIFLLASFKIYLTFFLSLLLVPYTYLFMTGVWVSLALFVEQSMYSFDEKEKATIIMTMDKVKG